jgi:hypothetical protein
LQALKAIAGAAGVVATDIAVERRDEFSPKQDRSYEEVSRNKKQEPHALVLFTRSPIELEISSKVWAEAAG